jgi:hypothetical protein
MRGPDNVYIRPTGLVICKTFERDFKSKSAYFYSSSGNAIKLKGYQPTEQTEKPKTEIPTESKKKIRNALNNLYAISDIKRVYQRSTKKSFSFRLNFITLTLSSPQKHDDKFIKLKLLEPFLKWMQYNHNLNSYIWKAETQKNGNIHFHITTNIFIHYKAIRNKWNQLQSTYKYIPDRYTMYEEDVPNSTDVHSVRNAKQCIGYMQKYMTKSEPDKRQVNGQIWNCSKNLKTKPPMISIQYVDDPDKFQAWVKNHTRHKIENEYATIFYSYHEGMEKIPEPFYTPYKTYLKLMATKETTQKYFTLN